MLRIPPTTFAQFPFAVAAVAAFAFALAASASDSVVAAVDVVVCRSSDLEIQFSHLMPSADGWRRFVRLNSCV